MSEAQTFDLGHPLANQGKGWCLLCNEEVDADIVAHFDKEHATPDQKPKIDILGWQDRIGNVIEALGVIQQGDDPKVQISQIDEVLQDLYIVRARLGEKFRDKIRPKGR